MIKNRNIHIRVSQELLSEINKRYENVSRFVRSAFREEIKKDFYGKAKEFVTPEIRAQTPYIFFADIDKITDGDTIIIRADLGFYFTARIRIRLLGIDAPSIKTPQGQKAKAFIEEQLKEKRFLVETRKKGKYGRYLAYVYYYKENSSFEDIIRHGKTLNQELIDKGLAVKT